MSNHESEIMAINHRVSEYSKMKKRVTERLRRQGWCKWTTIKRVRKLMLELLNHPLGDRDAYIRAFIKKYHYYGIEVVTDLELSENSDPALVKELNNYCEHELEKLKKQTKQKRKDIRRLATVNRKRIKQGKVPLKHLPVYNRTRDQRNHARNTRRNLRVIKENEEQIQLLCEQEKQEIEAIVDEAFSLENYGFKQLPPVETPETPFDWSNIHEYEEPTGLLEEFLEVVSDLEPIEEMTYYCTECGVDMGPDNPRQLCGKTTCLN